MRCGVMTDQQSKSRNPRIDAVKGVAITLVVIGHTNRGLIEAGLGLGAFSAQLDALIYAFHMPFFFFLSGLFIVGSQRAKGPVPMVRYWGLKLFYPMILWSYLFLLTKYLAGSLANAPVSLDHVLIVPVPGILHFWFLWSLLCMHVILYCLRPVTDRFSPLMMGLGLFAVSAAVSLIFTEGVPGWLVRTVPNLPFLSLGVIAGALLKRGPTGVGVGLAGLAAFGAILWFIHTTGPLDVPRVVPVTAMLIALAFAMRGMPSGHVTIGLAAIGGGTMAIYVAHTLFSATFRAVLVRLGFDDPVGHLVSGTLVGLVGPYILWRVSVRMRLANWLGF